MRLASGILAGQERPLRADGRRLAVVASDGARRRAAPDDGRADRDDRRSRADPHRGRAARADRLPAARRVGPGEVGDPPRRALRRGRRDDRRRAVADARPHRAHARGGGREGRAPRGERHASGRPSGCTSARSRCPATSPPRRRSSSRRRSCPAPSCTPRRQPQPAPRRAAADPRAHGGEGHRLQPPRDRRRAGRRPRGAAPPSSRGRR